MRAGREALHPWFARRQSADGSPFSGVRRDPATSAGAHFTGTPTRSLYARARLRRAMLPGARAGRPVPCRCCLIFTLAQRLSSSFSSSKIVFAPVSLSGVAAANRKIVSKLMEPTDFSPMK
jgi:hypothetical protein